MDKRKTYSFCPETKPTVAAGEFITERLPLAIFLHADQHLPFLRCETALSGKVRFVFLDSEELGAEAELDFDRGAEVSATKLFASQKFLRRKMSEEINTRKHGKYDNKEC